MVGRTILQYQLIERLGAGGMGEVYKAQDTRLNRFVAIKVLPDSKSGDPGRRRRFFQEAKSASALNHPNIITIHDILSDGDTEYMVMECIDGKTLGEVIPDGGIEVSRSLQYAAQMAGALAAAHSAGIIHRDLKPGNVMIAGSGLVKILDFGLAKLTSRTQISESDETVTMVYDSTLTTEGSILGTVSYMSPEQAQGKTVDARSDIFSFGALLYEMLTGRRAFEGDSNIATLTAVLRDEVKPIREVAPVVPSQLEQIVSRCLRKDPDQRWQTMKEVYVELAVLKQRLDSGVLSAGKRYSKAMAIGAVAVVVTFGAGGWWISHRKPAAQVTAAPAPMHGHGVLTNDSILEMIQAKVPVPVIITHIRASTANFDLSTAEVIRLTKAGVPERVIEAMHDPKASHAGTER